MEVQGIHNLHPRAPGRTPGITEPTEEQKSVQKTIDVAEEAEKARKIQEERARLVLKPKELTPEERMQQVISPDDIKRLMYMYAFAVRGPRTEDNDPLEPAGRTVDLKS